MAPYAVHETGSRGRCIVEAGPQYRGEFQRDRDRIIHSAAFRRLEYKTQVFVNHEGDLFRTRLTHSLEVAQISRSVARTLGLNEDLTESIALAHDLGHTPFGHAGQDALNHCMRAFGGFEHNFQSLRVVDMLEQRYAAFDGLNLCFETREGILKHCSRKKATQLGDVAERFVHGWRPSMEAQLANVADKIAYNNHDVDDGLRAQLLDIEGLMQVRLFAEQFETVRGQYPGLSHRRTIHEVIRRMINRLVNDLIETTRARIDQIKPQTVQDVREAGRALVGFSDDMHEQNQQLKRFLLTHLYKHFRVHRMAAKARLVIQALFDAFMDDPALLPPQTQQKLADYDENSRARPIADYIAGMTDRFAIAEHDRLFNPASLS